MGLQVKAPFPFGIRDIVGILRLRVRYETGYGMDVDCPFCGHARKMHLDLQKNVFRCNRCGKGGGMLELFCSIRGLPDRKAAYQEIQEELRGSQAFTKQSYAQISFSGMEQKAPDHAPPEVCHRTYQRMLEGIELSRTHANQLRDRGLSAERIRELQFRSTPTTPSTKLVNWLISNQCQLEGVPGFYKNGKGQWLANFNKGTAGLLIPVVSADGMISGFQIRLDHPFDKRKYMWFTSVNKLGGTSSGSPPHFVGDPKDEVIYITEGSLKADVANSLLGKSFGAVAGVTQYAAFRKLLDMLTPYGPKTLCEAYDMDQYQNIYVEAARREIIRIAREEYGFKVYTVKWNPQYKGIDDWALARTRREVH